MSRRLDDPGLVREQYATEDNLRARQALWRELEGDDARELLWQAMWPNATSGNLLNAGTEIPGPIDTTFDSYTNGQSLSWATPVGGTTVTGMPASAQASTSSYPRAKTNGSPPLSRTTNLPALARSIITALMAS